MSKGTWCFNITCHPCIISSREFIKTKRLMDNEKWRKITASFNFVSPDLRDLDTEPTYNINQFKCTTDKPSGCVENKTSHHHPSQLQKASTVSSSIASCEVTNQVALQREIEQLKALLHEKCQLIETHENTICELRAALNSLHRNNRSKHEQLTNDPTQTVPNGVKESTDKAEGNLIQKNGPGFLCTQNVGVSHLHGTSSADVKQSRNYVPKSTHTRAIDILPLVADRLDKLEKHMDELMKKLPSKLKHFCQEYVSNCKVQYNEETREMVIIRDKEKPRSPKIKPKYNTAFELRSRKNATARISDQQEVPAKGLNNEASNPSQPSEDKETSSRKVTVRLKHLEGLVEELKSSFVQLLVDRLKCKVHSSNPKLPQLKQRLSKLQVLRCPS